MTQLTERANHTAMFCVGACLNGPPPRTGAMECGGRRRRFFHLLVTHSLRLLLTDRLALPNVQMPTFSDDLKALRISPQFHVIEDLANGIICEICG